MTRFSTRLLLSLLLTLLPLSASAQYPDSPHYNPTLTVGPLTLYGYLLVDWLDSGPASRFDADDGFGVNRARVSSRWRLTDAIRLGLSAELTTTPALRDAYVALNVVPGVAITVGQHVIPFSQERGTSTAIYELVERSPLSRGLSYSRELGVSVQTREPLAHWLMLSGAIVNGTGENARDDNHAKDLVGRVAVAIPHVHGLSVGASGAVGDQPSARRTRSGADAEYRGARGRVAVELRRERLGAAPARWGYLAIGVLRLAPVAGEEPFFRWELATRYIAITDPTLSMTAAGIHATDDLSEAQFGGNYFLGSRVRVMVQAIVPTDARAVREGRSLLTRLQVNF